jgi:hypothetical protein
MKKLFRFYCLDCDNAWHEILEETESYSHCDFCNKKVKPEEINNEENHE